MNKKNALPPLAFGHDIAILHECAKAFSDLIDRMFPGMNAYDPLTDANSFRSRTAALKLPHLKLVAATISPTYVDRKDSGSLTLMLPFAGDPQSYLHVGQERVNWGLTEGGVFLPETSERVYGGGGFRSHILWQLDRELLLQTAQAMLGSESQVDLQLDHARLLPKKLLGVDSDAAIRALLPLIELYARQPETLARLGVEDMLYRQSVMLLRPDLFADMANETPRTPERNRTKQTLQMLCEYIMANLSEPLYLSDLERLSGQSARSLQMAFKREYGCSPMAWINEQRLLRLRHLLITKPDYPIETLALATGFQSMPTFFQAYKRRFGETPGQTRGSG